jgi:hypothetical protein
MRWESSSSDQKVDPLVANPDVFAPLAVAVGFVLNIGTSRQIRNGWVHTGE